MNSAAFRSIHERHGGAEIGEVRRQAEDSAARDATRDLANSEAGDALGAYRSTAWCMRPEPASRRAAGC